MPASIDHRHWRTAIAGCRVVVMLVASASLASGQERPVAFVGGRVLPITGPAIEQGTIVVAAGKIVAVGPAATTPVPADAERIDATGKVIMPGLVDTHSHVGGGWGGDASSPIQPDVRILDSINVRDAGFRKCRAGGLTTLNIMPGSGHLLSGQTIYAKLRKADTIDDILYRDAAGRILGGMKMANGTNSQKEPPFPGTRSKSAAARAAEVSQGGSTTAASSRRPAKMPRSGRIATSKWKACSTCSTAA